MCLIITCESVIVSGRSNANVNTGHSPSNLTSYVMMLLSAQGQAVIYQAQEQTQLGLPLETNHTEHYAMC
jgi:hypothetical protein